MNIKKALASILGGLFVAAAFSACNPDLPPDFPTDGLDTTASVVSTTTADTKAETTAENIVNTRELVFFTSTQNPVDGLSSEQIRGIYSARVTNWSEVGGEDKPIKVYQRPDYAESQAAMITFMGETELTAKTVTFSERIYARTAEYKNSPQSIGYSLYSPMIESAVQAGFIKILAVDGVTPTPVESIPASDEYALYNAVGTGEERPADFTPTKQSASYIRTGGKMMTDFLVDKEYEAVITEWTEKAIEKAADESDEEPLVSYEFKNGYLSVFVGEYRHFGISYHHPYGTSYAVFDLKNKKQLTKFTDLFYKDSEFVPALNEAVSEGFSLWYETKKADFIGIVGEPTNFTLSTVTLSNDYYYDYRYTNDFLPFDMITSNCDKLIDYMPSEQFYDFSELMTEKYREYVEIEDLPRESIRDELHRDFIVERYIESSRFWDDEYITKMNKTIAKYYDDILDSEFLDGILKPIYEGDTEGIRYYIYEEEELLVIYSLTYFVIDLKEDRYVTLKEMFTDEAFDALSPDEQKLITETTAPDSRNGYYALLNDLIFWRSDPYHEDLSGTGERYAEMELTADMIKPRYQKILIYYYD
jgi:hypothetical protein